MTDRIQELADQAKDSIPPGMFEPDAWIREYNRKFAELIVKETLQVARAGVEYGDGIEDAVYRYFGINDQ